MGHPRGANYAAAKGGVLALTMSYAKEFSALGITVNAICPGLIDSDMTRELPPELLVRKACRSVSYDKIAFNFLTNINLSHSLVIATHTHILYTFQKIFLEGVPLKRIGKPEEVAGMCRFLALDPAADLYYRPCFQCGWWSCDWVLEVFNVKNIMFPHILLTITASANSFDLTKTLAKFSTLSTITALA